MQVKKNPYPKWNTDKWKHGLKPAVRWLFNFDPYTYLETHPCISEDFTQSKAFTALQTRAIDGNQSPFSGGGLSPAHMLEFVQGSEHAKQL